MGTEQIKNILIVFSDVMHRYNLIQWFFNWVGWCIISLFKYLVDGAEYLLNQVYSLNDFIFSDQVQDYIKSYQPILWILFGFALLVLGWTLIIDQDKKPKVLQNFIISILVLTALPVMIVQISSFTMSITEFAKTDTAISDSFSPSGESSMKVSDSIIISNTTDLLWCHAAGWENLRDLNTGENIDGAPRPWNNIKTLDGFDINEKIWIHDSSKYYHNYDEFKYYLSQDSDGNNTLETIQDAWWGFLIEDYFRYHVDWFPTILTLLFTALALLFAAYKVARLIWELAVHQLLAMIFAAGDLTSGQKLKEILKSMGSIFFTIYLVSVMLKFFLLGVSYLQTQTQMNGFVKALIIVFFALAAIDGPNIIERILGIDAGIRSGFHTGFAFVRGFGAAKRTVGNVGRKAASATGAVTGKSGAISQKYNEWKTRNVGKDKGIHNKENSADTVTNNAAPSTNGESKEGNNVSDKAKTEATNTSKASVNTASEEKQRNNKTDASHQTETNVSDSVKKRDNPSSGQNNGGIYNEGFKTNRRNSEAFREVRKNSSNGSDKVVQHNSPSRSVNRTKSTSGQDRKISSNRSAKQMNARDNIKNDVNKSKGKNIRGDK